MVYLRSTQTLLSHSLHSKCHMVSRYTHTHNLIHVHKKSMAFPVPMFIKLINAQTHYVQVPDRLPPNLENKCSKYGQKFIDASKDGFHCANFQETQSLCKV
jgi:hypothetical protein